jgi:hypothetical protein
MGRHPGILVTMVLLVLVCGTPAVRAASDVTGVTVALTPNQQVAPGATFDVFVDVTEAGSPFNAFDIVLGYDPAALTYVSHAEGVYMTSACGNTFHDFRAGAGTDTIGESLLCSGVSLPGPGRVYRLTFKAATSPQLTHVRFLPGLQFYRAGLYVNPVRSTDVTIGIGMPAGVGREGSLPRLSLDAVPNPSRGPTVFTLTSDRAGAETLAVLDVQGRVVRRFPAVRTMAGARTVAWDGRDEAGTPLAPGVYLARLEVAGRVVWSRLTLLR